MCSSPWTRGFAFVRFGTFHEEEKDVEMAHGRSWGGRKIQAQLSRFKEEKCLAKKDTCKNVSNVLIQKPPFSASSAWKAASNVMGLRRLTQWSKEDGSSKMGMTQE